MSQKTKKRIYLFFYGKPYLIICDGIEKREGQVIAICDTGEQMTYNSESVYKIERRSESAKTQQSKKE